MNKITMPSHISSDPILSECWRRMYIHDRNVLAVFCGGTGTRKSGSAITFCDLLDRNYLDKPRFKNERIVFTAQDFIKLVRSNLPKGSAIIWDEAGVDNDAREYYTKKNKIIKYVFQTFRYQNLMVALTVPDLKSIDIGTRKLMHIYFEMADTQSNPNFARTKVEWLQNNPKTGHIYFKGPRYWSDDGIYRKLDAYYIRKPRPELELPYKQDKDKIANKWYHDFGAELKFMDEVLDMKKNQVDGGNKVNFTNAAKLIEERLADYLHPSGNRVVADLVEQDFIERKIDIPSYLIKRACNLVNIKIKKGELNVA